MKTIAYRIYQLPAEHPMCFQPWDDDTTSPPGNDAYEPMYTGTIDVPDDESNEVVCERIFRLHNEDHRPNAQTMRSMSVSDVVELLDGDRSMGFYYCNSTGFQSFERLAGPDGDGTAADDLDDYGDADGIATWDEDERGYAAAIGHGNILEIQAVEAVGKFKSDEEAVMAALNDGVPIIPVGELPSGFEFTWWGFVDTPRNRERIKRYANLHPVKGT